MGIDVENGKVFSMAIVDEDGTVEFPGLSPPS